MSRRTVTTGLQVAVIAVLVLFWHMLRGPHMTETEHLRTWELEVPLPPAGAVAARLKYHAEDPWAAVVRQNPLPATEENLDRGRTYYGYYCAFCHGEEGAGDGPVGLSFVPFPADLRGDSLRALPDAELLPAMLDGVGHAPVLRRVVPPQHRWYLALFVRSLGRGSAEAATNRTEDERAAP